MLGWGSLLWDDSKEFESRHGPWQSDGPCLKIEFSRISSSRGNALTLVIDPENGVPTEVAWCLSRRRDIAKAVKDLSQREGTNEESIGKITAEVCVRCHDEASWQSIYTWLTKKELAGVVWTDLRSNFVMKKGEVFSIEAAMRHLKNLEEESKARAFEYLRRAPSFVRTPLRAAFEGCVRLPVVAKPS